MTGEDQEKSNPPENHTLGGRVGRLEKSFLGLRARVIDRWYRLLGMILAFLTVVVGLFAVLAALLAYFSYSKLESMKNEAAKLVGELEDKRNEAGNLLNEAEGLVNEAEGLANRTRDKNDRVMSDLEGVRTTLGSAEDVKQELEGVRDRATKLVDELEDKRDEAENLLNETEELTNRTRNSLAEILNIRLPEDSNGGLKKQFWYLDQTHRGKYKASDEPN